MPERQREITSLQRCMFHNTAKSADGCCGGGKFCSSWLQSELDESARSQETVCMTKLPGAERKLEPERWLSGRKHRFAKSAKG